MLDDDSISVPVMGRVKLDGYNIEIPLRYRCRAINIVFPIVTAALTEIEGFENFKPLELIPGTSLLAISVFDFYQSPVGPYKELTLSVPVASNKDRFVTPVISLLSKMITRKLNYYVVLIAESTDIAIKHGTVINGYPHYMLPIEIETQSKDYYDHILVSEGTTKILELSYNRPKRLRMVKESYDTYFRSDGFAHKIRMEVAVLKGGARLLKFVLGSDHAISAKVRSFSPRSRAIACHYYDDVIEVLYPKVKL